MNKDLSSPISAVVQDGHQELAERTDPDARTVVSRLTEAGYEAYLVGGCVRDLLLDRTPKDFDVATSAHPSEIRMLFKNCRLIGRRFRLAHIYFRGGKIIETATFRANPFEELDKPPDDLLINQDNVFGNAEQDARRRDFTINGLFFSPDNGEVIDYVGGLQDLEDRVLRTIGDPDIRIQEDPVRILRAAKFAAKLGFTVGPRTSQAIRQHAAAIERCASARVVEEIYRIVHCGFAKRAVGLLVDLDVLPALLPELAKSYRDSVTAFERLSGLLGAYDEARTLGYEGSNALALALLTFPIFKELEAEGHPWLDEALEKMGERLRYPKRDRERARGVQHLCVELDRKPRTERLTRQLIRRAAFAEALVLYTLQLRAAGEPLYETGAWKARAGHCGLTLEGLPGAAAFKRSGGGARGGRRTRRAGRGRARGSSGGARGARSDA